MMKTNLRQILLPAILLGGVLLTPGCGTTTPRTITIGASTKSDRTVLSVSSPVPTKVQCVWQQNGSRIQHQNTTPFRLILPGSSVYEVSLSKPAEAADVMVKIRPPRAEPSTFVMDRGTPGLKLERHSGRWERRTS